MTASVLAPRLIVKEPAIGHRSMLAENFRKELEVILKYGKFQTASLPGAADYGWLEHDPQKVDTGFPSRSISNRIMIDRNMIRNRFDKAMAS